MSDKLTQKDKTWIAWAPLLAAFVTILLLFFVQDYSRGYGFVSRPIFQHVIHGYKADGGEWSFGFAIPFAVLVLVYLNRKELGELPKEPDVLKGGALLLFSLLVYFMGFRANEKYLGYVSGQLLIASLIIWFGGLRFFFKLFWVWCLLGMLWPWLILIGRISTPLQIIMVELTSGFLRLTGVDLVTQGTAILTDTADPKTGEPISLNVAAACSGIRSFFAMIMISLVMGLLQLRSDSKRFALLVMVPIVTIAGNFVRMLMLYYGSKVAGTAFAIGEGEGNESGYHIISGLVVFVVAIAILLFIVTLLNGGLKVLKRKKVVSRSV